MKKILLTIFTFIVLLDVNAQPTDYYSYWPLNGNTVDLGPNQYNGTNNGASLTEDRFGNPNTAYYFDGTNDYIDFGTMGNFGSQMNSFTLSIWVKTSTTNQCSILKTINNSTNTMIGIDLNRNNSYAHQPGYTLFDLRGEGFKRLSGHITFDLYDDEWHFIILRVIDASSNNFEVYIDGSAIPVSINYQMSPTYVNYQYPFVIGAGNVRGTIQEFFNGSLDDLRLYTRALSTLECLDLYNSTGSVSSLWQKSGNHIYFNTGNVGIGTTSLSTYKLSVNGTIRTKEVIVETGWSDFVFEKNYQLKSLQEVEIFINENGHLPDIPSAREVEENGVKLGEMESKLLQKIEELTLYVIELKKENGLQQTQLERQSDYINRLIVAQVED